MKDLKKIKVKNEGDLEYLLSQMTEQGLLKEHFDTQSNELKYSLLPKGRTEVEELLKTNRTARMFLIQMHMNFHGSFNEALLTVAKFMKETFSINLFQDVVEAIRDDELVGIEIKDKDSFVDLYNKI